MCGRFTRKESFQQLAEALGLHHLPQLEPRYNIAPSQLVACVRTNPDTLVPECVQLKWGLVPSWAKDPGIGHAMINARAETVAQKPSFRRALLHRRCLVLADGFYEWKREGKKKQPYYIHFQDNRPFAFAGLWEHWQQEDRPAIESCAIITTSANAMLAPIHHRMPVILPCEEFGLWLDSGRPDAARLVSLLTPYPAEAMEAYPVSHLVNHPSQDVPACLRPVEE